MALTKTKTTTLSRDTLDKAKRVKAARNLSCLTRDEMNKKYNIPPSTLRGWETPTESRNQGLTLKGAKRFSDALRREGVNCSIEWLMEGKGIGPHFIQKKTIKKKKSSLKQKELWQEEFAVQQEIKAFEENNPDSLVVLCLDDGLEPFIEKGDYVGGIKKAKDFESLDNSLCIIKTTDNNYYIRKVSNGKKTGHFNLSCINPKTSASDPIAFDVKIKWAAKIIWLRKTAI